MALQEQSGVTELFEFAQHAQVAALAGHKLAISSHFGSLTYFDVAPSAETIRFDPQYMCGISAPTPYEQGYRTEAVLRGLPMLRKEVELECIPQDIQVRDRLILTDPRGKKIISRSITKVMWSPDTALFAAPEVS